MIDRAKPTRFFIPPLRFTGIFSCCPSISITSSISSTFRRITLPLSLPGLTVGCTLVFSLTAGSFVTPAILGGTSGQMLGVLVEQQILIVYNWPFGAACATVLVAIVLGANLVSVRILDRRRSIAR